MIICTVTIRSNHTYGYYRSADGSILASDWLAHLVRARSREVEAGILLSGCVIVPGLGPFRAVFFLSTHFR
jgi:hypothetical protein